MVLGVVKRKILSPSRKFHYICFGLGLFVALYGIWVFVKRDFFAYLFLQSEFVFLDYEEPNRADSLCRVMKIQNRKILKFRI